MDEDRVEYPAQAYVAHVAEHVLTLRVERRGHLDHRRRKVHERQLVVGLEEEGVVSASAAQLEDMPHGDLGRGQQPGHELSLCFVLLDGRDERPPLCEVAVEVPRGGGAHSFTHLEPEATVSRPEPRADRCPP